MGFVQEFKEFINRGNVMDMAVGIIIGGAFTAIVTSLTGDIINPLITLITGGGTENAVSGLKIPVGSGEFIDFGAFISAIINFLIIALVVFCLVKAVNKVEDAGSKLLGKDGGDEEKSAPTCPYCKEEVKPGATRCPHCAGEFDAPAA